MCAYMDGNSDLSHQGATCSLLYGVVYVVSSISWSGSTSILFFFLEMHSGWVGCDLRPLVPIICLDLVILFYFILLQRWEWCTIS